MDEQDGCGYLIMVRAIPANTRKIAQKSQPGTSGSNVVIILVNFPRSITASLRPTPNDTDWFHRQIGFAFNDKAAMAASGRLDVRRHVQHLSLLPTCSFNQAAGASENLKVWRGARKTGGGTKSRLPVAQEQWGALLYSGRPSEGTDDVADGDDRKRGDEQDGG